MSGLCSNPMEMTPKLSPCVATASMFLFPQGSSIICVHHDNLTVARRFDGHTEDIQLLAVDNVSEKGSERLVASYDIGQTVIVWNYTTGNELARVRTDNSLTVATWMRNGNVVFGNVEGKVVLLKPTSSECISRRTNRQVPITALAPAADNKTYAIGFSDGSLVIVNLHPKLIILHHLDVPRRLSPTIMLAWHSPSSRQKSDMLATQTLDGNVKVWSISKSPTAAARIVRVLKHAENLSKGASWLGWSKNGRIIQLSGSKILSWDVRTKNVTWEAVPTIENIIGLAIFGPGATLFILGRNIIQKLDLNSPPHVVLDTWHSLDLLPPPLESSSKRRDETKKTVTNSLLDEVFPFDDTASEDEAENQMSPLARITAKIRKLQTPELERYESSNIDAPSSVLSISNNSGISRSSLTSASSRYHQNCSSNMSHTTSDGTVISIGSSRDTTHSFNSPSPQSFESDDHRARSSSLRHELLYDDDAKEVDLFKFTKTRLSNLSHQSLHKLDKSQLTNCDPRTLIFRVIFDWPGDAKDLIEDEISKHAPRSVSRLLLTKWLGEIDEHIMTPGSESMSSSDWMLLALSGISGHMSQNQVARAYVQRLLDKNDTHTAATIMIGMGDYNDAIQAYVSRYKFVEALILTCLVFPVNWQRQSLLVQSLGEWALQHNEKNVADRCFACLDPEIFASLALSSHHAARVSQQQNRPFITNILSPPLSPPSPGYLHPMAQAPTLKLITSFGDHGAKSQLSDFYSDAWTSTGSPYLSSQNERDIPTLMQASPQSAFSATVSARTVTPGGFQKHSLPSIGEMPPDITLHSEISSPGPATPVKNSEPFQVVQQVPVKYLSTELNQVESILDRASTTSPMIERPRNLMISPIPLPSPPESLRSIMEGGSSQRSRPSDRKPEALQIQWPPIESIITGNYMKSPNSILVESLKRRSSASSVESRTSLLSDPNKSPVNNIANTGISGSVTGRILDEYIRSLECARQEADEVCQQNTLDYLPIQNQNTSIYEPSEIRGLTSVQSTQISRRSLVLPLPASQEERPELAVDDHSLHKTSCVEKEEQLNSQFKFKRPSKSSRGLSVKKFLIAAESKLARSGTNLIRHHRQPSLENFSTPIIVKRGRGVYCEGSTIRSPSSPLPMSHQMRFYREDDRCDKSNGDGTHCEKKDSNLTYRQSYDLFHDPESRAGARESFSETKCLNPSLSRPPSENEYIRPQRNDLANFSKQRKSVSHSRSVSNLEVGDIKLKKDYRTFKKEQASRELEERRQSLARRPSAPTIIRPEEIVTLPPSYYRTSEVKYFGKIQQRSQTTPPSYTQFSSSHLPGRVINEKGEKKKIKKTTGLQLGLPATPKAMKLLKNDSEKKLSKVSQNIAKFNSNELSSSGNGSVISCPEVDEKLALLPRTTYTPARRTPSRSASAPIPEDPPLSPLALPSELPTHPAFHASLPTSSGRRGFDSNVICTPPSIRKVNPGGIQPGTLGYQTRNNPEVKIHYSYSKESNSHDKNKVMSNPPPPILKELQHLARPPPPPPPPSPPTLLRRLENSNTSSIVSRISSGSGVIEIIMEDEGDQPYETIEVSSRQHDTNHFFTPTKDTHVAHSPLGSPTRYFRSANRDENTTLTSQSCSRS